MRSAVPAIACSALLIALAIAALPAAGDDELRLLDEADRPLLYDYLIGEVERQAALRDHAVRQALASPDAVAARQKQLRAHLDELVGELPQRTPLNAKTVGTIECDGYKIEKVIYESRPRHHVSANLYLPRDTSRPVPGVLVPCGHSANGKASLPYQSVCVLLAQNGCAALIYDPIGQGERLQLPESPEHGTTEHTLVGLGALAVGWKHSHVSHLGRIAEHGLSGRPARGRSAAAGLHG
jgi:hypothetical protein